MKPRGLTQSQVIEFYDRLGGKQDKQNYYEDLAFADLTRLANFESATAIAELGCRTGRFGAEMLRLNEATYWGCDISSTMIELSFKRLAEFDERVTLWKSGSGATLVLQDESCDRFVSNYVLDVLSEDEIESVLREAKRVLKPNGLLCLTGLTNGKGLCSKAWTAFWNLRFALNPKWVGGCRPVVLMEFLDEWDIVHHNVVVER